MKKLFFFALILAGCVDEGAARSTLSKAGFTQISIEGYQPFACGEDDATSTAFTATNHTAIHTWSSETPASA